MRRKRQAFPQPNLMCLRPALFLILVCVLFCGPVYAGDWSAWSTMSDHPGVSYRVKCDCSEYSRSPYLWLIEFKNDYSATVAFSFRIMPAGVRPSAFSDRVEIRPGGTQSGNDPVPVTSNVEVWTDNWKIGPVH